MSSGQSFTSCGRDVDGGHLLRIGGVGTRSTVVGADGWRLTSGPKFLDIWLENQKANSVLSTAPSSRSPKPAKVASKDQRIKPRDSPKAGTTQSSLRPLMNADTSWLSSSFPGSALRQQQRNNSWHFWPKPWFLSGTRASTPMNSDSLSRTTTAWPAYRLVQIEPATDGAIRNLSQATLGGKHLSAHQVLATHGDPLRETRLNLSRFLNTRFLNRLHPTLINQHALGSTAQCRYSLDTNIIKHDIKNPCRRCPSSRALQIPILHE
jgi:hypothetical protein